MTGQDAANTAKAFNDALPLTGVVLAKADGDARGGAALSVRAITGKPIKFLGVGEKTDALEPFHPDRIASRILGMGDVLSLIEEAEREVDRDKARTAREEDPERRALRPRGFSRAAEPDGQHGRRVEHAREAARHGSAAAGRAGAARRRNVQADGRDHRLDDAATSGGFPDVINGSRKRRIASGSGTQIQDINRLLKQHKQMQKMMKKVTKKGGMAQDDAPGVEPEGRRRTGGREASADSG